MSLGGINEVPIQQSPLFYAYFSSLDFKLFNVKHEHKYLGEVNPWQKIGVQHFSGSVTTIY